MDFGKLFFIGAIIVYKKCLQENAIYIFVIIVLCQKFTPNLLTLCIEFEKILQAKK